jgi:hypothetical protein
MIMTRLLEEAFSKVSGLPDSEQDELARTLLELAGVNQPPIQLTAAEEADLVEAEAEIARGELASAEEVRAMWAKHGL